MTTTLKKPTIDPNFVERPMDEEAKQWRNLHFDNAGKSYFGVRVFQTQEKATEYANYIMHRKLTKKAPGICVDGGPAILAGREYLPYEMLSHIIPVPWNKE